MKKLGIVFATIVLVLVVSGCSNSGKTQQVQPQESKVVYVKPANISGASIYSSFSGNQYNLDTEDAQRLYKALEDLTILDTTIKYNTDFLNQITFYDENKKEIMTVSSVDPRIIHPYPLLLNEAGKVLSSKEFYRELKDLALRKKLNIFGRSGG